MKKWIVCAAVLLFTHALSAQIAVSASPLAPTSPAVYKIDATFNKEITPETEFEIVFPIEFSLSKVMMANSKVLGNLDVSVNINTIKLSPSGNKTIAPGTTVDFMIATIINAKDMQKNYRFSVKVRQNGNIAEEKVIETRVELLNRK